MKTKEKIIIEENSELSYTKTSSITVEDHSIKTYQLSPEIIVSLKDSIVTYLKGHPDFVRSILEETFQLDESNIDEPRKITKEQVRSEIHEFIKNNAGCKTSEIIESMNVDPLLVMEILKELKKEQFIQSKSLEQ